MFHCLQCLKLHVIKQKLNLRHASTKAIRVGCASGFWGDTSVSSAQLVHKGNINYLVSDYLSEITMSLLTAAKRKDSKMGYAPDFVSFAIGPQIEAIKKKNVRVLSNAGGTNPIACAEALQNEAKKVGQKFDIAVVLGDDIMPLHSALLQAGQTKEIGSSKDLPKSVMSMNAYFGAEPIRKALKMGAEVVVTGRCVDSALVLAPLMHEFNWTSTDYNRLASGSLAGHLLECGAQSTGGIFTDWQTVPDWDNIGFPIAECCEDGSFHVTKPNGTGGLVTPATVSEQLVYEIGDPSAYILPDVTCDFRNVQISQDKEDSVSVTGARGYAPTSDFKVCATYLDGFRTTAVFSVGGKRAIAKGRRTAESILKRVRHLFSDLGLPDFKRVHVQAVGDESLYGESARKYGADNEGPRETVVWMAVEHEVKKALELFSRELAAAGTGMAPGLCGIVGGRPKVSPVLKLFSFLHPKQSIPAFIHFKGEETPLPQDVSEPPQWAPEKTVPPSETKTGPHNFILEELAYTRSGDKGNSANIGVIARHPAYVPYLRQHLTAEAVYAYFKHLFPSDISPMPVQRFELPGVNGFNFLMTDVLGGGGVASVRIDPQGKSFGQMLLDIEIRGLPDLKEMQ